VAVIDAAPSNRAGAKLVVEPLVVAALHSWCGSMPTRATADRSWRTASGC
jgi:hypothetical protein